MKNLANLLLLFVLGFSSCDKINDLNTKEISNVEISETVLIEADVIKSTQVKIGETEVPFSKTLTLDLNNISEIQNYLNHLEDIDIKSVTCRITNISEDLISSLQISVPSLGYTLLISPIYVNNALEVSFTSKQLEEIANSILEDKSLVIVLSGTVEQAETFSIETIALADIEVEIL